MSDFFRSLRKKIEVTPTAEGDRKFWKKFDAEFSKPRLRFGFGSGFDFRGPAFAAALTVALAFGYFWESRARIGGIFHSSNADALAVVEKQDMLSRMDMFKTFDSIPDGLPISNEDWNILLPEGVPQS